MKDGVIHDTLADNYLENQAEKQGRNGR